METNHCATCHSPIPANAPGGFCPACLLRDAAEAPAPGHGAPPLVEIAAAFPRLEVLELIGQGGMGFVYKVGQPSLDRTVALKILAPELSRDPAFAERFAREARTLGKLQHPNIVTVFEHGESGGFFYLMMEYIDGVNLRQAMRAGRFSPEQALAIVPGLCDALQYAHEQGVWHRDIKPENILLDREGRVKMADFGIARIVGDPQRDFTLTRTGGQLGSAAYMAPEQHENPHDVDHRADIYSLGVVIYEMLTGELPLGRFPAPSQRAAVDARIDEIVFRTLEKERELRQQSASEVKTQVEGAAIAPNSRTSAQNNPAGHRSLKLLRWSLVCLLVGALLWVVAFSLAEPIRRATISRDWFPEIYVDQDSSWMLGALGAIAVLVKLSAVFGGVGLLGCLWALWGRRFSGPAVQKERELRQQSADEVKTELEGAAKPAVPAKPARDTQCDFPPLAWSVGLWLGGIAAVIAGLFTAPTVTGFGLVAAVIGFVGCGWLLWKIRRGDHPKEHRLALLIVAFWPAVIGLSWAAVMLWGGTMNERYVLQNPNAGSTKALFGYSVLGFIAPLVAAILLWKFFGADPSRARRSPHLGDWLRAICVVGLLLGGMLLFKSVKEQDIAYETHRVGVMQIYSSPEEPQLAMIHEAFAHAVGKHEHNSRFHVYGANEDTSPWVFRRSDSPYVVVEWTSRDRDLSETQWRLIENRLRATLPRRIEINSQHVGSYWDRVSVEAREDYRRARTLKLLLMILAPILAVPLALACASPLPWLLSVVALALAAGIGQSPWPAPPTGLPPSIDGRVPLEALPMPEYDFSTPGDTMESMIKAANKGDANAFVRGLAKEVTEGPFYTEPELASRMREWDGTTYAHQVSRNGDHAVVALRNSKAPESDALERFIMKREEGEWKLTLTRFSDEP